LGEYLEFTTIRGALEHRTVTVRDYFRLKELRTVIYFKYGAMSLYRYVVPQGGHHCLAEFFGSDLKIAWQSSLRVI
jgi:hypothetical protein